MKFHPRAVALIASIYVHGTFGIAAAENASVEKIRQVFPSIIAGMVCSESSPWISCHALKLEECDETVRDAIAPCMEKHFAEANRSLSGAEESALNRTGALCTLDGLFAGKGKDWEDTSECTAMRNEIFAGVEKYRRGEAVDAAPSVVSKDTFRTMVGDSFGRDLCERGGARRCLNAQLSDCVSRLRPLVSSCVGKALDPLPEQLTREMGGDIGRSAYNCIEESLSTGEGRSQFNLTELGGPGCGFHVN